MDTDMPRLSALTLGLGLAMCAGCDVSGGVKPSPELVRPRLGVLSRDIYGNVLLYTDREIVGNGTDIFILGTGSQRTVTCCARLVRRVPAPAGSENFFTNVDSDQPPSQMVYSVDVPSGALTRTSPIAVAAWNISGHSVTNDGYALNVKGSAIGYEEDSCFGSEGLNVYLKEKTAAGKRIARYYVDFGYAIDGQNCPEK